jgi:hypothetical protein
MRLGAGKSARLSALRETSGYRGLDARHPVAPRVGAPPSTRTSYFVLRTFLRLFPQTRGSRCAL